MIEAPVVVGIPTYNSEPHLEETLGAARALDWPHLRIVVRDDGSTDGTLALCERAAAEDARLCLVRGERHLGWIGNCNALFSVAHEAQYFCLLPHDDLCAPEYVREMVALLERRPDAVIAYSAAMRVDGDGRELGAWPGADTMGRQETRLARALRYLWWTEAEKGWPIHGVIRVEALRATGGLRSTRFAADDLLLFHLSLLGAFAYDPRVLCTKRLYPGTVSTRYGHSLGEWNEYLAPHHEIIEEVGLPLWERVVLHTAVAARRARLVASRPFGIARRALRR